MKNIYFIILAFISISHVSLAGEYSDIEKNAIESKKNYYAYFIKCCEQDTSEAQKLWNEKYSKYVKHKNFAEVPFKLIYSQGHKPDCVPTCIAMICDYYNVKHDPPWKIGRRIRSRHGGRISGTSIENTIKELKSVGLHVGIYTGWLEDLKEKIEGGTPLMVPQKYSEDIISGHMRIVIGYNDLKKEFTILDPNFGNKKMYVTYQEFMKLWEVSNYCTILAFK